ncbi:MAG: DsbA family protein [Alphaproteobacteria bacterium]|nr:DsbA family protein [Alphaproteobacteria bacterium]
MAFRFAALCLTFSLLAGNAFAAASVAEKTAIEKAYAARRDADNTADITQRIAARWQLLANDPGAPVIGNANGDVTIVEFFDYTCPYCKAVEPRLEALLKADPKVKLVLKEFSILTPQSLVASRAALAAKAQGKYTAYHNAMMRFDGKLTEADIFDMAKAAGLDVARLKRDMNAPAISDQIISVFNQARGIRVFQTPAFIVNGRLLSSESASIDFRKEVAAARRR